MGAAPTAAELLALWERLARTPAPRRAVVLAGDSEGASLGELQAAALELYARTFGDRIDCADRCPDCGAGIVVEVSAAALIAAQRAAPEARGLLEADGWSLRYRLPVAADLERAAALGDAEAASAALVAAVVRESRKDGQPAGTRELPPAIAAALAERIEAEDPLSAPELAVVCPECGQSMLRPFDAPPAFLARLEAWARRTLWEVHQLAMRYGWSEADLLAMPAFRREAYLLMDAP